MGSARYVFLPLPLFSFFICSLPSISLKNISKQRGEVDSIWIHLPRLIFSIFFVKLSSQSAIISFQQRKWGKWMAPLERAWSIAPRARENRPYNCPWGSQTAVRVAKCLTTANAKSSFLFFSKLQFI
jgi:hypothetical protein